MKRIISFLSCFVIFFSSVACPLAKANVIDDYAKSSFAQYMVATLLISGGTSMGGTVGALIGGCIASGITDLAGYYAAGHTDKEFNDAYTDYVQQVDDYYGGTSFQSDGSVDLQDWEVHDVGYINPDPRSFIYLSPVSDYISVSSSNLRIIPIKQYSLYFNLYMSFQVASPVSVIFSFPAQISKGIGCVGVTLYDSSGESLSGYFSDGSPVVLVTPGKPLVTYSLPAGSYYFDFDGFTMDALTPSVPNVVPFLPPIAIIKLIEDAGNDAPAVSANTRVGKFSGDYFYEGDNGKQIIADKVTLFNETNNTVTNPATKETIPVKSWYYDYSDRSYHYTTDTGNQGIVKYGDDNASVTMQDSNGNTVTYNYYYYAKGSSGGGDEDPGDDGGKNTFKDLLVKFFSAIGNVLSGLIDGLLTLFTKVVDALGKIGDLFKSIGDKILGLFGGFAGFLAAVFPFLPEEFFQILSFGLILMIAAVVIRKLLR